MQAAPSFSLDIAPVGMTKKVDNFELIEDTMKKLMNTTMSGVINKCIVFEFLDISFTGHEIKITFHSLGLKMNVNRGELGMRT